MNEEEIERLRAGLASADAEEFLLIAQGVMHMIAATGNGMVHMDLNGELIECEGLVFQGYVQAEARRRAVGHLLATGFDAFSATVHTLPTKSLLHVRVTLHDAIAYDEFSPDDLATLRRMRGVADADWAHRHPYQA